jgi:hypothetical protein
LLISERLEMEHIHEALTAFPRRALQNKVFVDTAANYKR